MCYHVSKRDPKIAYERNNENVTGVCYIYFFLKKST